MTTRPSEPRRVPEADADVRSQHADILRALVENSSALIFAVDDQYRYTTFNRHHAAFVEECYSERPEVGRSIVDVVTAEEDRDWLKGLLDRALAGGSCAIERAQPTASPELRYFNVWVSPISDSSGRVVGAGFVAHEITERKKAERQLRLLSRAVEQSPVSVVVTDRHGVIEYVNPRFTDVTGYTAAEALGQNPRILKSGETEPRTYRELWQTIVAGRDWHGEFRNRKKNGELFYESASVYPLRAPDGLITNFIAIKEDVTARREAEQMLRATQQQLHQAQKMDSLGRLAGGIAHDFNNLLTVINGYAELVLGEFPEDDPRREDIVEIRRAGESAGRLTRQLLAFSQRQVLEPEVLDLNGIVGSLTAMLQRLLGEHLHLNTVLAPDLGRILADPGQIEQVLVNLAVNARDAMPAGGTLTVETRDIVIDTAYAARFPEFTAGSYVLLAVSDTGQGMTREMQRRAFEPFFTTKAPGKGTGLGLSTVYGIVTQSGGHVSLYSAPQYGTTVTIMLPRAQAGDAAAGSYEPVAPAGTETILLVEDDAALRGITTDWLTRCGYTVLAADRADEALAVAKPGLRIDLLVSDVLLPRTTGPELARSIGQRLPGLPVLFMSGFSNEAIVRNGLLDRAYGYLQKPFTLSALATAVRKVLDQH